MEKLRHREAQQREEAEQGWTWVLTAVQGSLLEEGLGGAGLEKGCSGVMGNGGFLDLEADRGDAGF